MKVWTRPMFFVLRVDGGKDPAGEVQRLLRKHDQDKDSYGKYPWKAAMDATAKELLLVVTDREVQPEGGAAPSGEAAAAAEAARTGRFWPGSGASGGV